MADITAVKATPSDHYCGYEDCEGVAPHDMLRWAWLRGECPEYPEVPQRGTVYRLPSKRPAG